MSPSDPTRRLTRLCAAFRTRLRMLVARAGISRVLTLAIVLTAGALLADWWLHLPTPARLLALVGWLATVVGTAWLAVVRPWRQRWSDAEVLAYLDSTHPDGGQLLDLHELLSRREEIQEAESERGRQLAASAITDLAPQVDHVRLAGVFAAGPANRWLLAAVACTATLVAATLAIPEYVAIGAERLFNPFSSTRWPHRTTIEVVEPESGWIVPQLESFSVEAHVTGDVPPRAVLAWRGESTGSWIRERLPIDESEVEDEHGNRTLLHSVRYTFPEVHEPLQFTLEAGDYETDAIALDVIRRPYVTGITASYTYPDYAGLPDRTLSSGQLSGLEGTQVHLEFETSMSLDRAAIALEEESPRGTDEDEPADRATHIELEAVADTTYTTTLMLRANGRYAVELFGPGGFREARPEVYEIRVTPDDPPEVQMLSPAVDLVETNQATLDVSFRARDQLGLASVAFVYQIDDGEPVVLDDRVTGPIEQTGTEVAGGFAWHLRRMELPESGTLRYFVRAGDNNPTGRGVVESLPREVRLVRPSEFHLEALEQAKLMEEEARIAWRNQLHAWQHASGWLAEGTGAEDDPHWSQLRDAQQSAFLAASQVRFHLQTLTEKYERNHMAQDFMAGRLSVIAGLVNRLIEQEHTAIGTGLDQARPKTDADAARDRLKSLRQAATSGFHDRQKMAVLILERTLRKLYDWRDLQTSAITARLLHEQQTEVLGITQTIAPQTIAREIEDLSDDDQEQLLTLGKQQRAIFDTETGLENQLSFLMYKAQRQARRSIQQPLEAAFTNLRNNRVNHHLKRAAEMIENNQPSQIIDNQRAALRALEVVRAGLLLAGQRVDPDEPLDLAMTPADESQFDPEAIKPTEVARRDDPAETVASDDTGDVPVALPALPEGTDPLSAAVRLALELQDNVLARTRYLHENRGPEEMPRFVKLKLLRIGERQRMALEALQQARAAAGEPEDDNAGTSEEDGRETEAAREATAEETLLQLIVADLRQSEAIVAAKVTDAHVQQVQADAIATLRGVLQHIAFAQAVDEATAENRRLGGVDAFDRAYLLRDDDLDRVVQMLAALNLTRHLQDDVLRKLARHQQHPAGSEPALSLESQSRTLAVAAQRQVMAQLQSCVSLASATGDEVAERVLATGAASLQELIAQNVPDRIAAGDKDAELLSQLGEAADAIALATQSLRDLLDQRVQTEAVAARVDEPRKITAEEFARLTSRERLAELLDKQSGLPPEIRSRMIKSLQREFPEKYRELLKAYYASFVEADGDEGGEETEHDEPETP